MKKILFTATILIGSLVQGQGSFESDSLALLDLFHSLGGPDWNEPWDLDANVADWKFVGIDNGRVTRFDVPYNANERIRGDIPETLKNLDQLTVFALRGAQLYEPFPDCLCELTELRAIVFENAYLYGPIPDCIGNLTNLQGISIPRNLMTGHIPASFYNLTNLTDVDLSINKFTGTISEDIGNLTSLYSLKLGANDFYGKLPTSLGDLPELVWFTFGDNRIEGLVPAGLTESSILVAFEANNNRLSGFESDWLSYDQRILTFGKNFIQQMPDITDLVDNGVMERLEGYDNPLGFDDMLLNNDYFDIREPSHFVQRHYVSVGDNENVSLTASDINPSNSYTWYKDDVFLNSSTDPGFTIANFQPAEAGKYSCYITNSEITNYEFAEHFYVNTGGITVKIFDDSGEISSEEVLYLAPDFENTKAYFRPRSINDLSFAMTYNAVEGAWVSDVIIGEDGFHFLINRGSWMTAEVDENMDELVRTYNPQIHGTELVIHVSNWHDLRPLPPTDLSISIDDRDLHLVWNAPDDAIDGYLVYRDDELLGDLGPGSLTFTDPGIPPTKKLEYTVQAYRGTHLSDRVSVEFSSPSWGEQINVMLMLGDGIMSGFGENNGTYSTPREDVWIIDPLRDSVDILSPGWGITSNQSGIELALGNRLGDVSENPLVIIKVTKSNAHLVEDWASPTTASTWDINVGSLYTQTIQAYQAFMDNPESYLNDYLFSNPKLSGIIWMNGYGEQTNEEHLLLTQNLISDLQEEIGPTDIYLIEPGNAAGTFEQANTGNLESIASQSPEIHFLPTFDLLSPFQNSDAHIDRFYESLDAYNAVGLALLDSVFYYIDLTATPNDHLVSFCVNDQETYQFEDYVSGRHFNVALLVGQDSMVSDYMMSEYVKSYDLIYEYYWDLFGWGYLGEEQAQQAHVMLAGGGGAGLGGVCASTSDLGYAIAENFGAPTGDFVTGLSAYSGASGTLIHELIHAFDGRSNLFIPSGDQAHSLTGAYEPLAYALTGIGQPLPNQAFMPPYLTLRLNERMNLDRWLTTPDLTWDDIFGDDAMDALNEGSYIMPRHKEHMLINAGIMMSLYEMHTDEHANLMNGIYQYAKDQDGGSLTHNERVDNWVRGAAMALNLDVSDYFDYWKYSISEETRSWLTSFPTSPHIIDHDLDGFSKLEGDWDDDDDTVFPEADETLDGKDNNLNGLVDEDVILDEMTDISTVSSSLPFVMVGEATDDSDVDEVTFTLDEESFVTFLIWWKDGQEIKPVANRSFSTEAFQGSVKLNGDNIIWPMQQWHSTPSDSHTRTLSPGTYTVSVQPEAHNDYPANPGEYELYVFVNDFKPEPFHYNGLVYQPKVFYALEPDANWEPSEALGISEKEAKALKALYTENGGDTWNEDGWMSSYEVPYWKNIHVGKEGVMYLHANLANQNNMVLPAELADLKNVYRVNFGNEEVCGGQAVIDWLDNIPVVETPYSYCPEGDEVVKVFILAGQSNMQGYGTIEGENTPGTLEYVLANGQFEDFPLEQIDEHFSTLEDAYYYFDRGSELIKGPITTGQGVTEQFIGPELMFASELDEVIDEPILIIKTAWGGKSLAVDFRPPSAGGETGAYYTEMINTVNSVTSSLSTEFPQLQTDKFEIAGVGWFQGWNDGASTNYLNEYASNLQHLINDLRTEFDEPDLPFVIANTGQGGYELVEGDSWIQGLQTILVPAQESVACDRDYEGVVGYVDTRGYYYEASNSPADAGHHFHNSALAYLNIGQDMGEQMIKALQSEAYCQRSEQTISFELDDQLVASMGTFNLEATSDAGLDVYFLSSDESIVTIDGNTAAIHSAGSVTISAHQDGDDFFEPASTDQLLELIKGDQTISFALAQTSGFSIGQEFNLNATATSGLAVSFESSDGAVVIVTGSVAQIKGPGTTAITASQSGDAIYNPAESVSIDITVDEDAVPLGTDAVMGFSIYPNPANGSITVSTADQRVRWIEIRNMDGALLMKKRLGGNLETDVDLKHLKPGIYLMTTSTGKTLRLSVE